ncbi:MAG: hypothetical protein IKZ88_01000 [Neisseriaceae bacterium]|nr:hypothetical protein [Neisseriaceae bacterium]
MSLRDLTKSNRGNPAKNRRFFANATGVVTALQKAIQVTVLFRKQCITTPAALCFACGKTGLPRLDCVKARNDTVFCFRQPEITIPFQATVCV